MENTITKLLITAYCICTITTLAQKPVVEGISLSTAPASSMAFSDMLNPISADPSSNTIVFIHRSDETIHLEQNRGMFLYDISTDNGKTWKTDVGPLNPMANSSSVRGAAPQALLYNPSKSSNSEDLELAFSGILFTNGSWTGISSGTATLDENKNNWTEIETNFPLVQAVPLITGLTMGKPGEFWMATLQVGTGDISLIKGIHEGTDKGISWSTTPINLDVNFYGTPLASTYIDIAFDPTGNKGWAVMSAQVNPFTSTPVFFKTTDGGNTWSEAIEVDLEGIPEIDRENPDPLWEHPSNHAAANLIVDENGNPHYASLVGFVPLSPSQSINRSSMHIFDITLKDEKWTAIKLDKVSAYLETLNPNGTGDLNSDNRIKASRTEKGDKLFFTWCDFESGQINTSANLFGIGIDVESNKKTAVLNFTKGTPLEGNVIFPNASKLVLETNDGDGELFTVPVVIAGVETSTSTNAPVPYTFINNVSFQKQEFEIDIVTLTTVRETKENKSIIISDIYPNPISENSSIRIELNQNPEAVSYTIMDALGQQLYSKSSNGKVKEFTVHLEKNKFSTGVYFVNIEIGQQTSTKKFIVK